MASSIKIRAKESNGVTTIKALVKHPMETGTRKNAKTGKPIPAHHITEVKVEHAGSVLMTANWGPAVSKNPYLSFTVAGVAKGETVKLSWVDNKGKSDTREATVS
jgi:sulfur-oxidizing protein SoxZ